MEVGKNEIVRRRVLTEAGKDMSVRMGIAICQQRILEDKVICGMLCILHLFYLKEKVRSFLMQGQREKKRTWCCISCQC